ncbi:MAG: hypothetical protein ACXWKG_03805 [Limisphaerales bacterium]
MFKISTALLFASVVIATATEGEREVLNGPAYSHFHLTLEDGWRTEVVAPFFYTQKVETEHLWGIPPLFDQWRDESVEASETDYLYPLLTIRWYGKNYRWQFFQLFSFAGGPTQEEVPKKRFTVFPIYFQQRSPDTNLNYTAVVPFYGHLVNRLFRDDIRFVMFPFYSKTRKRDIVVKNYLYPFGDVRHGNNMHGWQVWPFYGHDVKGLTYQTNALDEVEKIGGYDHKFIMWPFYVRDEMGIGTDDPEHRVTIVPFYTKLRSPKRDSTSWGWPFGHTLTDDRAAGFTESDWFWPLYVHADGSKTIRRAWPFYSHATNTNGVESHWYGWILWKKNRLKSEPLDRQRTRVFYFLYSDITEKNTKTAEEYHRVDFWPFYTYRRDMEGRSYLQVLSIIEPVLPNNTSVVREYSPVYSLWRAEENPKTGMKTQSLLWNLYRREVQTKPSLESDSKELVISKKVSFFFGLFQYRSNLEGHSTRLFYIPMGKEHKNEGRR